jgi:hypothetical protein
MNNNTKSTGQGTLIACTPQPLSMFKYQAVFNFETGKKYLKSINLLQEEKILKKFHIPNQILISDEINLEQVILDNLTAILIGRQKPEAKKGRSRRNNTKTENKQARAKAATDLFENLGI